jgi:Protein of unknown function (DUF3047)
MAFTMMFNSVLFFMLLFAPLVRAEDRVVIADFSSSIGAPGVPAGWQLKEKSGKADFAVINDGDIAAGRFRSANTSFSLQKEVNVDLKQFPLLTWKWKVTKLPKGGDFRKSKTDDQAAQLFVAFSKTKAIVYIWDTTAPAGLMEDTTPAPFMTVKVVVQRSGPAELGKWITETRNVYDDYKKLYGAEPPAVNGIRLQSNSQHTGTSGEGYFADVMFKRK